MSGQHVFADREEAGIELARVLAGRQFDNPMILGLPRGGVPVAFAVARALGAPLDVIVVRKMGAPFQPELAIGAIASGGVQILNDSVRGEVQALSDIDLERIARRETAELGRREFLYRGCSPYPDMSSRDVILVDDGMATGATMCAAVAAVRKKRAGCVVVAVPTASSQAVARLRDVADDVVCLHTPMPFQAVGNYYRSFEETSDETVRALLDAAHCQTTPGARSG